MLDAVIIEDEEWIRKSIKNLITTYCPKIRLLGEADGLKSGIKAIQEHQPDIVFLDVDFGDGSTGFDLLDNFPNPNFYVIFITAYKEFAFKAFRYNAIDYLVKPIDPDLLLEAVEKVDKQISQKPIKAQINGVEQVFRTRKIEQIFITSSEGCFVIRFSALIRIRSTSNVLTFYTSDNGKLLTTTLTMSDLSTDLPTALFFRTHQSHIINRRFVLGYINGEGMKMKDESIIPVSKRKKSEVIEWLKKAL